MNDALAQIFELALAGVAGILFGLLFFGGLRWTIHRAFDSTRPALWVGVSLLLRMAGVAAGFVVVSAGDWRRLLSCLLGFWAARWLVIRLSTRVETQPSAASHLSIELARGRSRVNSTLSGSRAQSSDSVSVMRSDGKEASSAHGEAGSS
ncbi:ATP synthase subunit I [Polaromonas sp.]|uniref:ATP synthase subunit I n=1 Tax=Polaromonas sp. TaxID=1869339 RepID=UPI0032670787